MIRKLQELKCYCDSDIPFLVCCQPLLSGKNIAGSAKQLMRSRFSAFVTRNKEYAYSTWHNSTCPVKTAYELDLGEKWVSLQILDNTEDLSQGTVEFIAGYIDANYYCTLHETSRFVKESGQWFYLDGSHVTTKEKLTRNSPCPCGSRKKFKHCCGK